MRKYEEAVRIAIDDTINIAEKLAVYINPATKAQAEAMFCLTRVCIEDGYNALMLKKFIDKYGDMQIPKGTLKESTTIKKEMTSPLGLSLIHISEPTRPY
eukprot:TRINITY_DN3229_c0_g2_i2.p2 TRINITY_DN3229_c0_g2~~TRINITY_DN3229_c0_g2_i2.p2  ORF type:complete len:100 (+),score=28.33 TRINITY_DN3229_c0_g2_i2:369-668(+)